MRLRQIKIAGFKSFADPVLIELDDPLVGIVGPNGCGKSNIIDAVRWVLGEARVSELRGSSTMKELIFSGSSGRRPMGRASVELVLTNEDGRLKGAWAEYAEISVKRQITAEGQSTYYINGQVVRRRDVQDIFMGTGLGPRSYAIISQGMIANFVKARPEELRQYLEEAAGVSLYRERRKETESLLTQTRANLERAHDLQSIKQDELGRLEGEAEIARRWQDLTRRKNEAEALWYYLQYEDVRQALDRLEAGIAADEAALVGKKAEIEKRNLAMPALRTALEEARNRSGAAQAALRAKERDLTLFEGEQKRLLDIREGASRTITEAGAARDEKAAMIERLEKEAADVAGAALRLEEGLETLEMEVEGLAETALGNEDALTAAKTALEAARSEKERRASLFQNARNRGDELGRRLEDLRRRMLRLEESGRNAGEPDSAAVTALEEELAVVREETMELAARLEEDEAALVDERAAQKAADEKYFSLLSEEKELGARLSTLEAVQAKAGAEGAMTEFEAAKGLDGLRRLSESLEIDPEWVEAIEGVLLHRANAIELRFFDVAGTFAEDRPPAPLGFVEGAPKGEPPALPGALVVDGHSFEPLVGAVEMKSAAARAALPGWLSGHYRVGALSEALAVRDSLPEGTTLVTPEGDRVTRHGVEYWTNTDPSVGMLSRKMEMDRLEEALFEIAGTLAEADAARKAREESVASLTRGVAELKAALRRAQDNQQKALVEAEKARQAYEQALRLAEDRKKSREELEDERDMTEEAFEDALVKSDEEEAALREAESALAVKSRAHEEAERLARATAEAHQKARHRYDIARLEAGQHRRSAEVIRERLTILRADVAKEEKRIEEARAALKRAEDVDQDEKLAAALKAFQDAEAAAAKTAADLEAAETALETAGRELQELQGSIMPLSEAAGAKRVEAQMKKSLKAQFDERLTELGADRIELAALVAEESPKVNSVRARVQRLISEIAELGPINHAALEHLEVARKALEAAQRQIEDLEKAIETLENAIRKIDQETRDRLKETFDLVNGFFSETFVHLFGGGSAELVMTGEDILDAGVEVRAQPPGKRNNSIRLLSGGEQALTATALVFGLFKLNPAPFCLLDEVDAPLDEANQGRLARLCEHLSSSTQFLMITHHRVTMEYARALIGVTMKEPGVSRVVSVAVEEARRMVEPEAQ